MSFGEKMYPSNLNRRRLTCPSVSFIFILSPNVISAIFCIRKRMVVLKELSFGLNEMPLPTSILGIFARCSSISFSTRLSIHFFRTELSFTLWGSSAIAEVLPAKLMNAHNARICMFLLIFIMLVVIYYTNITLYLGIVKNIKKTSRTDILYFRNYCICCLFSEIGIKTI